MSQALREIEVMTPLGAVRGAEADGVSSFKGIPYGRPVAGAHRFQPPRPAEPWVGVRDATQWGSLCPQPTMPPNDEQVRMYGPDPDYANQREDCLQLNVFTSSLDPEVRRPTMVMFHGGAFSSFSATPPRWDGSPLARHNDVVVVTVNHRIGALGYLYLGELGGDRFARSSNLGQQDLVLALRWVRDNISAFGGDPDRVTIFGESGGGGKVAAMLAMPDGAGLFHRAICESPMPLDVNRRDEASAFAERMLNELGVTPANLEDLDTMPLEQLVTAQTKIALEGFTTSQGRPWDEYVRSLWSFLPVVDGTTLPEAPMGAVANGASSDIPLIVGTTANEASLMTRFMDVSQLDDPGLRSLLEERFPGAGDTLAASSAAEQPDAGAGARYAAVMSDAMARTAAISLAEQKAAGGTAPVYMYRVDWHSPRPGDIEFGAYHGIASPLFMNTVDAVPLHRDSGTASALAARASGAWASYAGSGDPNHAGLPHWAPYQLETRSTMIFDDTCRVEDDPRREAREVWEAIVTVDATSGVRYSSS